MTYSVHKDDLFIVSIKTGVRGHVKLGPEVFSNSLEGLCLETAEGVELGDPCSLVFLSSPLIVIVTLTKLERLKRSIQSIIRFPQWLDSTCCMFQ